jgi:hypothetical protein
MFVNSDYKKCIRFLKFNGWEYDSSSGYYEKENCIGIDISNKDIVIIDGSGEYMITSTNYFTLVGILI